MRGFDEHILNCHYFKGKFKILLLWMARCCNFSSGNANLYTMQTILNKHEGPLFHEEVIFKWWPQWTHGVKEKIIQAGFGKENDLVKLLMILSIQEEQESETNHSRAQGFSAATSWGHFKPMTMGSSSNLRSICTFSNTLWGLQTTCYLHLHHLRFKKKKDVKSPTKTSDKKGENVFCSTKILLPLQKQNSKLGKLVILLVGRHGHFQKATIKITLSIFEYLLGFLYYLSNLLS